MANPVDPRANLPAISTGGAIAPLIPTTFREALEMAAVFSKSQGVPRAYQGKPDDIVVAIMHGMEVGLPPLASVQNIATINGKPSLYGDAQLAVVMGSGLLEDIEETIHGEGDQMTARCRVRRRGVATEAINTFSVADAKKAGLWGKQGPWTQHPKRMLKFRARSFSLRDLFADRLLGISSAEEAQDAGIGPEGARDVTPETKPKPTSRLDALESVIDAEAISPADDPYAGMTPPKTPTPRTDYDPDTGEVRIDGVLHPGPETGEIKEPDEAEYERRRNESRERLEKMGADILNKTEDIFPPSELPPPSAEKIKEVEAWANKTIRKLDAVTEVSVIDTWLENNKEALARARGIAPDEAMAVVDAAHSRKLEIQREQSSGR